MTTPRLRIVFFGTPDFAEASLRALAASEHEVVGVVTAPDRKAGRGQQLQPSRVKARRPSNWACPSPSPKSLRAPEFLDQLRAWNGDLFAVVAFRMLPEMVWAMPPRGTVNVHGSLPPDFRGCAHPACHRGRCGPHGRHVLLHHPRHRYRQPAPATFHARDAGRHGGFRLCTADGRRSRVARRHRRCPRGSPPPRRPPGPIDAR